MTATERLRQLLDERGVEWEEPDPYQDATAWVGSSNIEYVAHEGVSFDGPTGRLILFCLTPEQAVDATLGRGTCRDVCNSVSEFTCIACGFNCDLTSWISLFDGDEGRHRCHHHGTPNYCPNCGRRVEDE